MSSRLVDGVAVPVPVAGHPALEFCNTRAGWGDPEPKEYLVSPLTLAVWSRENGLVSATEAEHLISHASEGKAEAALTRALDLREALYRVALGQGTPQDAERVTSEVMAARASSRLVLSEQGRTGARWEPDPARPTTPDLPVLAVAAVAGDLLTGPLWRWVSACPGQGCGWLFADPRGRRRWCTMAVCGNRAKARRHREEQRVV